jgi:hypothetical protein
VNFGGCGVVFGRIWADLGGFCSIYIGPWGLLQRECEYNFPGLHVETSAGPYHVVRAHCAFALDFNLAALRQPKDAVNHGRVSVTRQSVSLFVHCLTLYIYIEVDERNAYHTLCSRDHPNEIPTPTCYGVFSCTPNGGQRNSNLSSRVNRRSDFPHNGTIWDSTVYYSRIGDRHLGCMKKLRSVGLTRFAQYLRSGLRHVQAPGISLRLHPRCSAAS